MSRPDIPAARTLHTPVPGMVPPSCRTCRDIDGEMTPWPCPTAEALGAEPSSPYVAPWGGAT